MKRNISALVFSISLLLGILTIPVFAQGDGGPDLSIPINKREQSTSVNNVEVLPDGKIMVSGVFDTINGSIRKGIAKLRTDGSLENNFSQIANRFNIYNSKT